MTLLYAAIGASMVCALIAAALLIPLTYKIPQRMAQQWVREIDAYQTLEISGASLTATPLTRPNQRC